MRKYVLFVLALLLILIFLFFGCEKSPLPVPEGSTLIIRANPAVVPPSGVSEITVFGTEKNGTPLRDGVEIFFGATMGKIEPQNALIKDGEAKATFYAGTIPGVAVIKAMARGGNEVTIEVEISSYYLPSKIVLTASPANISWQGGSVKITVTVFNEDGYPVGGVPLTLTTNYGSLASRGNLKTTNSNGQVIDTLNVGQNNGEEREIIVTATNGALSGSCVIKQETNPGY